jgi:hypothetical protein
VLMDGGERGARGVEFHSSARCTESSALAQNALLCDCSCPAPSGGAVGDDVSMEMGRLRPRPAPSLSSTVVRVGDG